MFKNFTESTDRLTGWRILDSPFCRIVYKGHNDTLVSFSPINCAPGKFFTTKTFASDPRNTVFLNCPKNSWYLEGIPGLGHDLPSAAQQLGDLLTKLGMTKGRTIFWGGSMGGYGAVTMGALMDADIVIATGAELKLLVEGGNSNLILRKLQGKKNIKPPDVGTWVASSTGSYFLYCGEFAYYDLVSLSCIIPSEKVHYRTLRDFGHALPAYIERTYGLAYFIDSHLDSKEPFKFTNNEIGNLWKFSDWWADLHATVNRTSYAAVHRLQNALCDLSLDSELRAHMAHALSLHASTAGDVSAASQYALQAVELTNRGVGFHLYRLACAMRDNAIPPSEWLPVARSIPSIEDPYRWEFGETLIRMAHDALKLSCGDKAAKSFVREQITLSSKHAKRVDFLRSLNDSADCSRNWKVAFTSASKDFGLELKTDREILPGARRLLICGFFVARVSQDRIVSFSILEGQAKILRQISTLDSPGIGRLYPEIEWSAQSRFRIEIEPKGNTGPLVIQAHTADGRNFPCFTLNPRPDP